MDLAEKALNRKSTDNIEEGCSAINFFGGKGWQAEEEKQDFA